MTGWILKAPVFVLLLAVALPAGAETADPVVDEFGGTYFTASAPAALDETFDEIAIARWAEEMLGSIEPAAGDDPFADIPTALPDAERLPLPEEFPLP